MKNTYSPSNSESPAKTWEEWLSSYNQKHPTPSNSEISKGQKTQKNTFNNSTAKPQSRFDMLIANAPLYHEEPGAQHVPENSGPCPAGMESYMQSYNQNFGRQKTSKNSNF